MLPNLLLSTEQRQRMTEKIILVITGYPMTPSEVFDQETTTFIRSIEKEVVRRTPLAKNITFLYTSVVKCVHDKDPTVLMTQVCEHRLKTEIQSIKPDLIICLGKGAAGVFGISGKFDKLRHGVYNVKNIGYDKCRLIMTYGIQDLLKDYTKRGDLIDTYDRGVNLCYKEAELKPPDNYYICESAQEFEAWVTKTLDKTKGKDIVMGADIETSGWTMTHQRAYLRCISFSWAKGYAICIAYEDDPDGYHEPLKRLLESHIQFVFHNAPFDVGFMRIVNNIHTKNIAGDTGLMAYLLNPGKGKYGYPLKPLLSRYTDLGAYDSDVKEITDDLDESGNILKRSWEKIDMTTLSTYNCCDSDGTLQLYWILLDEITNKKMRTAQWIMTKAIQVIVDMQVTGFIVDTDRVADWTARVDDIIKQYEADLVGIVGASHDWNSAKVIGDLLYDHFKYPVPTEQYSSRFKTAPTDDVSLSIINTPFTYALRKYRKAYKLHSTYLTGYLSKVDTDGRLRADFNLNGTATGRLSSSEPKVSWAAA